jgi:hypothetical protein
MQRTVKERHLSHGLSAQHETTYFAGTGAIQAIEQPAPVLSVCAGRGDPRLAVSKLHHLAWGCLRADCLDPTGAGRTRWAIRWKPALNAFAIAFGDRFLSAENY